MLAEADLQSAVNTVRVWKVRRESKGKSVTRGSIVSRALELWPAISDEDAQKIADRVMK